MLFCYNIDEMRQELILGFINQPEVKLVSLYFVCLKVTEHIDNVKIYYTVLLVCAFRLFIKLNLFNLTNECFMFQILQMSWEI